MNDIDINTLRNAVLTENIFWIPDDTTAKKVCRIDKPPLEDNGNESEPSDCAYLLNGNYIALYNAELHDFAKINRLH